MEWEDKVITMVAFMRVTLKMDTNQVKESTNGLELVNPKDTKDNGRMDSCTAREFLEEDQMFCLMATLSKA